MIRSTAVAAICLLASCSSGGNAAPIVALLAPGSAEAFDIGRPITIEFSASDDNDPVAAEVVVIAADKKESTLATLAADGSLQSVTWDTNGFPIGPYRIEVRATDALGGTARASVGVEIRNVPGLLRLVAAQPAADEEAVPRNAPIRLVFNTSVLPASVTGQSVVLQRGGPDALTRPRGSLTVSGNVVVFDPTRPLATGFEAGDLIRLLLPADGLRNLDGEALGAPVAWQFRTGCTFLDTAPGAPAVTGVEFSPGGEPVAGGAAISIRFSKPMDPTTLEPRLLDDAGGEIRTMVEYADALDRVTVRAVAGYGPGARTLFLVLAGAPADLTGTPLPGRFERAIQTDGAPAAPRVGAIVETFSNGAMRAAGDAVWGGDIDHVEALVSPVVTRRIATVNIAALMASTPEGNQLPNDPPLGMGGPAPEGRYCPTASPLTGPGVPLAFFDPPTADGRRRINVYKPAELGGGGTIVRMAWGPDLDALFAATYPRVVVRLAHRGSGSLLSGGMDEQLGTDRKTVVDAPYEIPQVADVNGDGIRNNGFFDWPALQDHFDYDGFSHLVVDVHAQEGTTWQQMRTWLNVFAIVLPNGALSECNCFTFECRIGQGGFRQMDSTFMGNFADPFNTQPSVPIGAPAPPPPAPGREPDRVVNNPMTGVDVAQFEFANLASRAESHYYDTGSDAPDYRPPRATPAVQPCGAELILEFSGSADGVSEDVGWTTNIDDLDGMRYVRFRARLRANLYTGGRARLEQLEIPFVE